MDYREKLKRRQQQAVADKGKTGLGKRSVLDFSKVERAVNLWKPRMERGDENAIDIVPFRITQSWYSKLQMVSGRPVGLEPGDLDYALIVPIHRMPTGEMFLCRREAFGKGCARCDEMFDKYRQGDKDGAKELRPGWRCFYNIYDYDDADKGVQLWESSYYTFEATSKLDPQRANLLDAVSLDDGGIVTFADLQEGKTIIAKFKKKVLNKSEFPELSDIRFEDREPYGEDILEQTYPLDALLVIPSEQEVHNIHYGLDDNGEELPGVAEEKTNDIVEGEEKPKPERTRRARGTAAEKKPEPTPATTGSRSRGRQKQEEKKPDVPPWDKDGEWGQCPAGGNFGYDCNSLPECDDSHETCCPPDIFEACLEKHEKINESRMQEEQKEEEQKVEEQKQEEKVSAPATMAGRTRKRR